MNKDIPMMVDPFDGTSSENYEAVNKAEFQIGRSNLIRIPKQLSWKMGYQFMVNEKLLFNESGTNLPLKKLNTIYKLLDIYQCYGPNDLLLL